jgi:hypothetical protein
VTVAGWTDHSGDWSADGLRLAPFINANGTTGVLPGIIAAIREKQALLGLTLLSTDIQLKTIYSVLHDVDDAVTALIPYFNNSESTSSWYTWTGSAFVGTYWTTTTIMSHIGGTRLLADYMQTPSAEWAEQVRQILDHLVWADNYGSAYALRAIYGDGMVKNKSDYGRVWSELKADFAAMDFSSGSPPFGYGHNQCRDEAGYQEMVQSYGDLEFSFRVPKSAGISLVGKFSAPGSGLFVCPEYPGATSTDPFLFYDGVSYAMDQTKHFSGSYDYAASSRYRTPAVTGSCPFDQPQRPPYADNSVVGYRLMDVMALAKLDVAGGFEYQA